MNVADRRQKAIDNFMNGYNCSQSVVLAFSDLTELDESTLSKLSSPFGGGMGRLREVCGAITGMFIIAGLIFGYEGAETGEIKAELYARIQKLGGNFEAKRGTLICRELLGLDKQGISHDSSAPEARTAEYYAKRPCPGIVGDAAGILAEYLAERNIQ